MEDSLHIPELAQDLLTASQDSVATLAERLSRELSLPALVTNSHYHLVASAFLHGDGGVNSILAIEQVESQAYSRIIKCEVTTNEAVYRCLRISIIHKENTIGYLFLVVEHDCINMDSYQPLLEYAASLFAVQLQKRIEIRQEKMNFKKPFLFDLLYGNMKSKQEIMEYGKVWEWDFSLPHRVIVFSLMDFTHVSSDKKLVENLLYVIEKKILEQNRKPITMMKRNQVIVILAEKHETPNQNASFLETFANSILNQMDALHSDRHFACGIGKTYMQPTDLFRSFQEAKVALEIGELLKIQLPFFTDLGLERILYKHDLQDLKEFYETSLGNLLDYDEKHETDLVETLEMFAANQFDMTATSKAMFLHRNTLRYRVKKIEEILGYKLDDWNNKLKIVAAQKIKQLRKI